MAVVSDLSSDARVRREAAALADAGHRVSVIGFDYQVRRPVRRDADGVLYRLLPFPARGSSRPRRLSGAAMFFARASIAVLAAPADAVHAHNLHLTLPCALAARLRRAKLVYDAHELTVPMVRRRFRGLAARYERMIWRRADAVVTTNESRARFFSRLHGGPAPLVLGNYPVEPPAVQPEDLRRRFSIPSDGRILLYQGGLYEIGRHTSELQSRVDLVCRLLLEKKKDVFMDILLQELDGIKATSEIVRTRGLEQVRVLIITTYDTDAYVFEALQAGASGFLLKDAGPAELLHAIRVVAAGEALLAPRITRRLIAQFTAERIATQVAEDRLAVLTQREREVLVLVGQGLSNDEIGAQLFLSPATARTHVSHAMGKLGARDRAQLVVIAYQTGLVSRRP